jgi:hypothetical protein
MAVFFPGMDTIVGAIILLGSPAIGYIILRCISVSSKYWEGWKRLAGGTALGIGWSGGIFYVFQPLAQTNVSVPLVVEYFGYAGMGLFFLTALLSLTNRLVIARALAHYFPREHAARASPTMESAVPYGRAYAQLSYKPSQLRAPPSRAEKPLEEPLVESGEDVLALLKEENFEAEEKTNRRNKGGELTADILDESERVHGKRKHAPMDDLGELAGFEETLAQLKRDLKDFNEDVTRPATRRGKNHE